MLSSVKIKFLIMADYGPSINLVGKPRDQYQEMASKQMSAKSSASAKQIPAYPLAETRSKQGPAPPKYLVRMGADSNEEIVQVLGGEQPKHRAQTGALAPVRIKFPPPDARPFVNKTVTDMVSDEKAMGPPHRFGGARVDSSMDTKGVPLSREALHRHNLTSRQGTGVGAGGSLTPGSYGRPPATPATAAMRDKFAPPANAPPNPFGNLPRAAALRKFEAPVVASEYARGPQLSKRTPGGAILGTHEKRYVENRHVPEGYAASYSEEEQAYAAEEDAGSVLTAQTAGPENPVVPYTTDEAGTIVWAQCWDDEAGAVYYFNNLTGEASWLPPE